LTIVPTVFKSTTLNEKSCCFKNCLCANHSNFDHIYFEVVYFTNSSKTLSQDTRQYHSWTYPCNMSILCACETVVGNRTSSFSSSTHFCCTKIARIFLPQTKINFSSELIKVSLGTNGDCLKICSKFPTVGVNC